MEEEVFEVGKYYKRKDKHSFLAVRGKVDTTMWGDDCLVGESTEDWVGLVPINDSASRDMWVEVSEDEWEANFKEKDAEEEEGEQ